MFLIFLDLASKGFEKVSCSCMQCYHTRVWAWVTEYMQVSMLVNTMLCFNNRFLHRYRRTLVYAGPEYRHIRCTRVHSISGLGTFMHPAHALSRRSSLFYVLVYIESATPTSWSSTSAHRKIELETGA